MTASGIRTVLPRGNARKAASGPSLNCSKCGLDVHWVSGLGVTPGHWAHWEPAPATSTLLALYTAVPLLHRSPS